MGGGGLIGLVGFGAGDLREGAGMGRVWRRGVGLDSLI